MNTERNVNNDRTALAISTKGLRIGYKERVLFDSLDLQLKKGELVCLMGPNGAGKSTLIRTLAGLQDALGGAMRYHSDKPQPKKDEHIAVVLTDKVAASYMTVNDAVAFGRYPFLGWNASLSSRDHEVVHRSLSQVHIADLAEQKLYKLSDGQLQLVMIARALAQETPVIILDEPTAHLDLNNKVEIMKLLSRLARLNNKSILLATHDLNLALQTADEIWLAGSALSIRTGMPEDLVLSGIFDETFQLKGFDLKTGKVQHDPYRAVNVSLRGAGYQYLWTKNALERNGFTVSDLNPKAFIQILSLNENKIQWLVNDQTYNTLHSLLKELIK